MSINIGNALDLNTNPILNVKQDEDVNSVVIRQTLNTELQKKADLSHTHSANQIDDLNTFLDNITLDGGVL